MSTGRAAAVAEPGRSVALPLVAVGVLALAVRILNVVVLRPLDQACASLDRCFALNGDALYSHLQGELLAQGHGFASSFAYWLFGDIQPGAGDPPLYVIYLGWVSALHGSGGVAGRVLGTGVAVGVLVGAWWATRGRPWRRWARALVACALLALALVSVLPGAGDRAGVHRPQETVEGTAILLPDGTDVVVVARLDLGAVQAHRLASALAGSVGVILLALVARRLGGDRAGLLAGGLAAVHPLLWVNDAMVLSESLYVPMVALVMLAAYRYWDHPDRVGAVALGATVALAGLTRAEALLLGPLVLIPLAWGRRRPLGVRTATGHVLWGGVVALGLVLPWMGYNLARFEEPTLLTAGTGAVLSAGSCDVAYDGEFVGYYGANCFQQYVDLGWVRWPDTRAEESVRDVPSRQGALRYIREHLGAWPRVAMFRVARMWQAYRPFQGVRLDYQIEGRGRWASWAGLVTHLVLLPAGVVGLVAVRRRRLPLSPLLAPAVVVSLTAAMTFGVTRYRVPADAALVVAAAVGIDAAWRRWWSSGGDATIVEAAAPPEEPLSHA